MNQRDQQDLHVRKQNRLRDLLCLVRIGLDSPGTLVKQKERTTDVLTEVKALREARPDLFDETDRLCLLTLEAEFRQYCGQFEQAASLLEPGWKELSPRLSAWTLKRRMRPKAANGKAMTPVETRALFRQQMRALLHYVFCANYLVAGNHAQALERLLLLKRIIEAELRTKAYTPCGTLAVCHYFLGRCHRVSREFHEAEEHFVLAQRWTIERAVRELGRTDLTESQRRYELAFKDVFTARILSGLAWVSLQRGQLLRAEQYLRTARALLIERNQESLQCFITLLFWTVVRRKTAYSDPVYMSALRRLEMLYETYAKAQDVTHQRRCASELLRGYLDLVEFGECPPRKAEEYMKLAEPWLERSDTSPSAMPRQRHLLHHARMELLKGQVKEAESAYSEALAASRSNVRQRGIPIMRAAIELHKEAWDDAARALKDELKGLQPFGTKLGPKDNLISDPLMEAQCYVYLALINAKRKNYAAASHYLGKWQGLSQFVDNYYLHHIAERIVAVGQPYFLEFDFKIFAKGSKEIEHTLVKRIRHFEAWLMDAVHIRHPELTQDELSEVSGISRSTLSRLGRGKQRRRKPPETRTRKL